ncbi:MAG: alpha/beta hydrolase [Gammaproteobacteria bacterium]
MPYRHLDSQEAIDAEYQIERRVPDARDWLEFYLAASAQARRELAAEFDVRFGPTRAETLDIFPAAAGAPVVVFIHGGYWRRLHARDFSFVARGLVGHGVTTVVTNYALCPAVTIAEITRQSRAAVAWLYHNIARHGGDPGRIVVAGHSAGGHQVARLLQTAWVDDYGLPADVIKGGYALSGLFDLEPLRWSWLQPVLQLDEGLVARESPCRHIPHAAPPLVAEVGGAESDEFHRQSREFVAAWNAAGLAGDYRTLGDCHHFNLIASLNEPDGALTQRLLDFVGSCAPARAGEEGDT